MGMRAAVSFIKYPGAQMGCTVHSAEEASGIPGEVAQPPVHLVFQTYNQTIITP
jgi:hypothetical protein